MYNNNGYRGITAQDFKRKFLHLNNEDDRRDIESMLVFANGRCKEHTITMSDLDKWAKELDERFERLPKYLKRKLEVTYSEGTDQYPDTYKWVVKGTFVHMAWRDGWCIVDANRGQVNRFKYEPIVVKFTGGTTVVEIYEDVFKGRPIRKEYTEVEMWAMKRALKNIREGRI